MVRVEVTRSDGAITLTVADDGQGFDGARRASAPARAMSA